MAANNEHRGGFEHSDINVIAVGKVGVVLLLATLVSMALVVGVFKVLQGMEGGQAKVIDPTKVFPQPQLQSRPLVDLKAYQDAESEKLATYGWADQQKGSVRIPISQAMDQLVQKGLPVRTPAPPAVREMSQPTESGLGSKMQQPGGPLGEGK